MTLNEIVIYNIKKYRKLNRMTQEQLAERCDTATSYIGLLETHKKSPRLDTIEKIAKALEINHQLLFIPSEMEKKLSDPELRNIILEELDLILLKLI